MIERLRKLSYWKTRLLDNNVVLEAYYNSIGHF